MVICLFIGKEIGWELLEANYYKNGHIQNGNEHFYFSDNLPDGFELGFYNWIVESQKLIGLNLHQPNEPKIKGFLNLIKCPNVIFSDEGINVFFTPVSGNSKYWIDYSECFTDFFFLRSRNGYVAFTFELPDDIEHDTSILL